MLPTTYRGNAIIDGERVSGVLHLSSDSVRLALDNNQEILRWPIGALDVDPAGKGTYELRHGVESFTFEPAVDDGLEDEISLRRRFFASPVEYATPQPPGPASDPIGAEPSSPMPPSESIAERVAAAGRHASGDSLLLGGGDRFRRYLLFGSLGLTLVVVIAIAVTVITSGDPTTAEESAATTASPTTAPAPPSTAEPVATTTPPAVAGATVTTTPPTTTPPTTTPPTTPTTLPPAGSVFEIAPSALAERWDIAVGSHSSSLVSDSLQENEGEFAFDAGPFVRLQGSTQEGTVSRIAFVGDPSGTVEDDREVLTGLGMTLSLVEPGLPPEGRRELLLALGLDVEDPDLGGLDNSLDYRGHTYWLRWDDDMERLVLDVRPNDDPTGNQEAAESEGDDS